MMKLRHETGSTIDDRFTKINVFVGTFNMGDVSEGRPCREKQLYGTRKREGGSQMKGEGGSQMKRERGSQRKGEGGSQRKGEGGIQMKGEGGETRYVLG